MTDRGAARRRAATIALAPAVAAAFGGSLLWASAHDPLAAANPLSAESIQTTDSAAGAATATEDRVATLTTQVRALETRIATLRATLAQQQADAAESAAGAAPADPAPAPAAAPAPAPAPAPPVHATTRASG